MGHSTTRAALIYLTTGSEREKLIAEGMGKPAEEIMGRSEDREGSGT
ncbi:integrase [Sphaerisporangium album]|uniref:Integrase n=1 Tax=Sphaerisporangium album TaxID=509200 RepID=A0A367FQ40_9ACTN|nr:integrase [Sphaerisporangium album]